MFEGVLDAAPDDDNAVIDWSESEVAGGVEKTSPIFVYPFSKEFYARPYEEHVYAYFQTRSKRSWATFVTETETTPGQFNDSNVFGVYTKLTQEQVENFDRIAGDRTVGVPVLVDIVLTVDEYSNKNNEHVKEGFTNLSELEFRNNNPDSPYLFAVGFYQEEAFTHLCPIGVETVDVAVFVDTPGKAEQIKLVLLLNSERNLEPQTASNN